MVTGPGDELAAAAAGCGRLRASHADRERAIDTLKAAFVHGMLAKDEFDLRVDQAFASRTYAELAALTADLPVKPAAASPAKPARAWGGQPVLRPGPVIMVTTALYAGVWPIILTRPANSEGDTPGPVGLLFSSATILYLFVLAIAVGYAIARRREKRSGGQPPRRSVPGAGGQASRRPPLANPGRELPPVDRGHRHTAEAERSRPSGPPRPGSRSPRRWRPAELPRRLAIAVQ
jgi:hypothetical protein